MKFDVVTTLEIPASRIPSDVRVYGVAPPERAVPARVSPLLVAAYTNIVDREFTESLKRPLTESAIRERSRAALELTVRRAVERSRA